MSIGRRSLCLATLIGRKFAEFLDADYEQLFGATPENFADEAMYKVKETGRNDYAFATP